MLTIYLRAFNALHAQNVTQHIVVQHQLKAAVLYALPQDTFINKTVTLNAVVTPRSNSVDCLWDFGDGSSGVHTNNTTVGYEYRRPGHYQVQVRFCGLVLILVPLKAPCCSHFKIFIPHPRAQLSGLA